MDEFGLIESFRPAPATTVAEVLARAAAAPDREEIVQAAADRAAADARAEQREAQMMLNRQMGDPLGNVSRYQAAVAECRDEVQDLEVRLEAARGRLGRASDTLAHWAGQADEVHRASVQRSDPGDLLGPAKAAHREVAAATRAARETLQSGMSRQAVRSRPGGRRPFDGEISRSEYCVYCTKEGVSDHDSYLLHSDPEYNCPVTTPEQAAKAEQAAAAERRGRGAYTEISR
jgi:hypothetical protein